MKPRSTTPVIVVSAEPEVIDLLTGLRAHKPVGVVDKNAKADCMKLPYLGSDRAGKKLLDKYKNWRVVLAVDPPELKVKLARLFGMEKLATVQAKDCIIASSARVGRGCIVQRGVKIMARASVGAACKLNIDASVHHDCRVGDFCTLAPGSRLLGAVEVGRGVYIGAGAVVLPRVRIGANAVVGAGAVVTRDVPPKTTVAGVPARPIK